MTTTTHAHDSQVYRVYDYLKENHTGKENGIARTILAEKLGLTTRALRKITQEINQSGELDKIVSTTHNCYICANEAEALKTIHNTYNVAITLFKKAKRMEKKCQLDGQAKIKIGQFYKDFVETFEE